MSAPAPGPVLQALQARTGCAARSRHRARGRCLPGRQLQPRRRVWFPCIDRNLQTYVPNLFDAKAPDFRAATHAVDRSRRYPSRVIVQTLPAADAAGALAPATSAPQPAQARAAGAEPDGPARRGGASAGQPATVLPCVRMSYRDELDATRARAAALERELAAAQRELAALRSRRSEALVLAGDRGLVAGAPGQGAARAWLGAPTRLSLADNVDGELDDDAVSELVDCVRRHTGDVGTVSTLRSSMAWSSTTYHKARGPFITVSVSWRQGTTTLRADERLGNLAGAIFGGVGGGVGGGAIMGPIAVAAATGPVGALAIPVWLGGIYSLCRALYRRSARRRACALQALFEELVAIARERARPPAAAG